MSVNLTTLPKLTQCFDVCAEGSDGNVGASLQEGRGTRATYFLRPTISRVEREKKKKRKRVGSEGCLYTWPQHGRVNNCAHPFRYPGNELLLFRLRSSPLRVVIGDSTRVSTRLGRSARFNVVVQMKWEIKADECFAGPYTRLH